MTPDELISTIQSLGASEDVVSKVREYIACQDDRERCRKARAAERQRLYMKRKMTPAEYAATAVVVINVSGGANAPF